MCGLPKGLRIPRLNIFELLGHEIWKNLRMLINSSNFFPETSVSLLWHRYYYFIPYIPVIYVLSPLLDCHIFEGRFMSDLSLNFPQNGKKCLTHNRCSVKGHWINNPISKSASPRKSKFQVYSSGKWFGVCFIPMVNATKRWSGEPPPSLGSRIGMLLQMAKGTMLQTGLQISMQETNASFSAVWRAAIACLWDPEDSAPATHHQPLASEISKNHNDLLTSGLKLYVSCITNLSYLLV